MIAEAENWRHKLVEGYKEDFQLQYLTLQKLCLLIVLGKRIGGDFNCNYYYICNTTAILHKIYDTACSPLTWKLPQRREGGTFRVSHDDWKVPAFCWRFSLSQSRGQCGTLLFSGEGIPDVCCPEGWGSGYCFQASEMPQDPSAVPGLACSFHQG